MDDREKIKAKIEQNQTDKQRLCDEAEKLNEELKRLSRPKLKQFDWCRYDGGFRIFIKESDDFAAYDEMGKWRNDAVTTGDCWKEGDYVIEGNLKDFFNKL